MNTYTDHLLTAGAKAYAAKLQDALTLAIDTGDRDLEQRMREQINQFFASENNGQAGIPMAVMC